MLVTLVPNANFVSVVKAQILFLKKVRVWNRSVPSEAAPQVSSRSAPCPSARLLKWRKKNAQRHRTFFVTVVCTG
jgi:hypothetical protein